MSRLFITSSKDTTLYEVRPNANVGYDEIVELGNNNESITLPVEAVRSIFFFPTSQLSGAETASIDIMLSLKIANADRLNQGQFVYIYPVSRSWDEGSGYSVQDQIISSDGATWRTYASASYWAASGSDYLSTPVVSSSLDDVVGDEFRVNVTSIVSQWISGSIVNNGFLLKFDDAAELNDTNSGNVKFFSRNTHTIHEPTLEFLYDGQSFLTGSTLRPIPDLDIEIAPKNLKVEYHKGEKAKIFFTVRDKYPAKTYTNTNQFTNKYYLPISSSYSIKDAGSDTTVIPHDAFSRVDCDATLGIYFLLDTTILFKNRFYEVDLKIPYSTEVLHTTPFKFKVV